jgi:uridine kinase
MILAAKSEIKTDMYPDPADAFMKVLGEIQRLQSSRQSPIVVALDGGSGAGKSTIALMIENEVDTAVIQIDDFFAADIPDTQWDVFSIEERLKYVFDWQRLRESALEPLIAGKQARWHAFDFESGLSPDGTYGMRPDYVEIEPANVILLDGTYSACPALADLVDLAVLINVSVDERHERLAAREDKDFLDRWHMRWDPVESYYFTHVKQRSSFDLVVKAK